MWEEDWTGDNDPGLGCTTHSSHISKSQHFLYVENIHFMQIKNHRTTHLDNERI